MDESAPAHCSQYLDPSTNLGSPDTSAVPHESAAAFLAMLPMPPPIFTASALTTLPGVNLCPEGVMLSRSTQPSVPFANSCVPRYIHVPPPIFWFTMYVLSPPRCLTVYLADEVLFGRLLYDTYTAYSPLSGISGVHLASAA